MKISNAISPLVVIFFAVVLRLLPHPPNVAPIAAMALFGGAYLNKKYALIVPLLAMFASDIFLGFHSTMPFVYGSFLLTGLIGFWIRKHKNAHNIIFASIASSLLFFIITNFGVWFMGSMYPKTILGLVDCYVAGIPFFRNTMVGDLLYVGVFFGSYRVILNSIQDLISEKRRLRIKSAMTQKKDI